MGKKIRIVLLTVTAVAAVFSFALMLDVRPGSDSTVLNAAKDRQSEPLLSVSEPLETDPGTIAAEEEMAEKVKGILLADDEFIGSISDQIYDGVPEMVNSWLAGEEGAAILQTLQDNGVDEAVARIVTEENINAIAERVAANLGTNDSEAFAAAADRLARTVASQIIIPQIQREVARNTVIDLYNANKDVIADDVIRRAVAEYASLTDAEKLELLSLDSIYYKYSDGMFADALKALEALPAEEKARIISFAETADKYYQENLPAVVEDIKAALGPEETIDVEKEVLDLYDKYRSALVSDMVADILAQYDALTTEEKKDVLGIDIESEVLALYDKYSTALAEDIAAYISANYPDEEIDIESEILALYDQYRPALAYDMATDIQKQYDSLSAEEKAAVLGIDVESEVLALYDKYYAALAEDIAAYIRANYPDEEIDIESEMLALYDEYRPALAYDMASDIQKQYDTLSAEEKAEVLGIDVESEVLALYDKYYTALAEDIAAYIRANYPDEEIDIESEILALYEKYKTGLAEDVIAYWNGNSPAVMSVSPDIESEVLALYDKYRAALVSDIIVDILNEYDSLSAEEKAELLGVEGISEQEILDLYEKYRTGLAEDVIAYWNENYPSETVAIEDEILALYEKYRTALAEDVIAYENANYPDAGTDVEAAILALYPIYRTALAEDMVSYFRNAYPEQDVRAEAVALYDEYKTQIAEDVASYIQENYPAEELDIESEVVSLYEANKTQIAEDIAQYILANYPAEEIDVRAEAEAVYEEYKDEIINAVISYIDENYQKTVSSWTPISNPTFSSGPILPEDAGIDEYQRVRSDIRQSEAARVSSLFAE